MRPTVQRTSAHILNVIMDEAFKNCRLVGVIYEIVMKDGLISDDVKM
jgi:hypothetical protein